MTPRHPRGRPISQVTRPHRCYSASIAVLNLAVLDHCAISGRWFGVHAPVWIPPQTVVGIVVPGRILAEGTWISGLDEVFLQLRRQLLLNPVKLTISSLVHQLARILLKGIEFLGGTLGKRQVVEPPKITLVLFLHQQLFGR